MVFIQAMTPSKIGILAPSSRLKFMRGFRRLCRTWLNMHEEEQIHYTRLWIRKYRNYNNRSIWCVNSRTISRDKSSLWVRSRLVFRTSEHDSELDPSWKLKQCSSWKRSVCFQRGQASKSSQARNSNRWNDLERRRELISRYFVFHTYCLSCRSKPNYLFGWWIE